MEVVAVAYGAHVQVAVAAHGTVSALAKIGDLSDCSGLPQGGARTLASDRIGNDSWCFGRLSSIFA